ncbi:BTAD domain-containing putative transcriptional regulator [Micromonospora sp. NPDC049559]|uniref:AfsR/SARP family transcriptional regulator n=1 Tax=Micromonospora sp. NPDC049559 TaxID=3155923 RepID=UPI003412C032
MRREWWVEFRLLGPVEVWADGRVLDAGPPQQRHVVAALAIDAGQPVPLQTLLDRVWDTAPDGARRALYAHIARIRRMLAEAGGTEPVRLTRRSGGYVLEAPAEWVDVRRFRGLLDAARAPRRDAAGRIAVLREALALWRGEPLAGLGGQWAARSREGLRQQRLDAVVAWAGAEVRAGDPAVVLGPLTDLAGEYPLVEPVAAALIRVLHAAGRTGEAVERYAAVRARLVEELGTDPGPELRAAHREILGGPDPAQRREVPAQLPAGVATFTGRADQLARLDALLGPPTERSGSVVIATVSGTAGVGKTALALHWAHRVRDRFPDGHLYLNLRGFDPTGPVLTPAQAVRSLLDALGVPPQRVPSSPDAQTALYRSLLAGRRVLVVLDNARDADQVRPLLPGAPGCLVLVTSRHQLPGLVATEGAQPLTLDLLTADEARQMLTRRLGTARVAAEPRAVDEIITACARLPLALAIVASRAALHPGFPLAALADELRVAHHDLDALYAGDRTSDVRTAFAASYRTLDAATARLFRLTGLHPGPDLAVPAAASLAGEPVRLVRAQLAELARAQLVTEHVAGRYVTHDLLRAYARELVHSMESTAERTEALHRLLDYYLHTAYRADRLLHPHRDRIALPPARPGAVPDDLADRAAAIAWLTAEQAVLLAAMAGTGDGGSDAHTWRLAWTVTDHLSRQARWSEEVNAQRLALAAARRLADGRALGHAHRGLGRAYAHLDRHDEADEHLRAALTEFAALDDAAGQAHVHISLARLGQVRGRNREALRHAQRALELFRAAGYRAGEAEALNAVGWYHAQLGEVPEALEHCERALELFRRTGDTLGEAATSDSLGYAHQRAGQYDRAVARYRHAAELFHAVGDGYLEAATLDRLGDAHAVAGDRDAARDLWRRAREILRRLDHPDAGRIAEKLDGPATSPTR